MIIWALLALVDQKSRGKFWVNMMSEQRSFFDFNERPQTWEDTHDLVDHPGLNKLLRRQLVFLSFQGNPQVSIRAIAMLMEIPSDEMNDGFDQMSVDEIKRLRDQLVGSTI